MPSWARDVHELDDSMRYRRRDALRRERDGRETTRARPVKLLFLAANPSGRARLHLDHEYREIRSKLRMSRYRDAIELISEWAVHVDDIQQALLEHRPEIVHLSSHGDASGETLVSDGVRGCRPLAVDALAELFRALGSGVRLVVSSSCFSSRQAREAVAHVDCAVGMSGAIQDQAAIVFAASLYRAIGFGRSVREAFELGVSELRLLGSPDRHVPELFMRKGVDAGRVVLIDELSAEPPAASLQPAPRAPLLVNVPEGTAHFVGRHTDIEQIETLLCETAACHAPVAIEGMPGVGKTALAIQLVNRLSRRFSGGIYWLDAEHGDLTAIWGHAVADALGVAQAPLAERATVAVRTLSACAAPALLVLDNVASWTGDAVPRPLPRGPQIHMLVTTRLRWLGGTRLRHYSLGILEPPHDRELLATMCGRADASSDELLAHLGGHALAIELAGAYLAEFPETTPSDYLRRHAPGHDDNRVERAFHALWDRLDRDTRQAWILASCFAPEPASTALADAVGVDAGARHELRRFHLLDCGEQGTWHMHRLTREFGARAGTAAQQRRARIAFIRGCERHARAIAAPEGTRVYAAERAHIDAALALAGRVLDARDASVASLRAHVGAALRSVGELEQARALLEQALAADVANAGADHPVTATSRANLAMVLAELGELEPAQRMLQQALRVTVARVGEDDPEVAAQCCNLALILVRRGDIAGARALLERSLDIDARMLGADHPSMARSRANLALVLEKQGYPEMAARLLARALEDEIRHAGPDHPRVATARSNLAMVLDKLGQSDQARTLLEQALATDERLLPENHPDVAVRRANLAMVLHRLGHPDQARALLEQALDTGLRTLGAGHPAVATRQANLAKILAAQGELAHARTLLEQVLEHDLRRLGPDHPDATSSRSSLAMVLVALGEPRRAAALLEQALEALLCRYGERHPLVAVLREQLGGAMRMIDGTVTPVAPGSVHDASRP
jgi:tetratricopeptide (TPR) repeat protein